MAHMDKTQLPHQEAMCQETEGILWTILCEQVSPTNSLMSVLESGHLLIQPPVSSTSLELIQMYYSF